MGTNSAPQGIFRAIIIDDESHAREMTRLMLNEFCPNVEVVSSCQDVPEAVKAIRMHRPDVLFLDIGMPGYSGIELLDFFESEEITFHIIFVTAYKKFALEAFRLSALDYLLKPLQKDELLSAVSKLEAGRLSLAQLHSLKQNLSGEEQVLLVSTQEADYRVKLFDLVYIEASGPYCILHLEDHKNITTAKHLKYFENALAGNQEFKRIHRSFMVNLDKVVKKEKSGTKLLVLENGEQIPYSSKRWDILNVE